MAHILEGSVQREGNQVRLIVQLINAREDQHMWSQTYDREVLQVLEVQSEVAQQIAEELETELSPVEVNIITEMPTQNMEAYDLFLRGRQDQFEFLMTSNMENFILAKNFFEQAAAMDSTFILPRVHLGWNYFIVPFTTGTNLQFYDSALVIAENLYGKLSG